MGKSAAVRFTPAKRDAANATVDRFTDRWMKVRGVHAVGRGRSNHKDTIVVYVSNEEIASEIPSHFQGLGVEVVVSGEIEAR